MIYIKNTKYGYIHFESDLVLRGGGWLRVSETVEQDVKSLLPWLTPVVEDVLVVGAEPCEPYSIELKPEEKLRERVDVLEQLLADLASLQLEVE